MDGVSACSFFFFFPLACPALPGLGGGGREFGKGRGWQQRLGKTDGCVLFLADPKWSRTHSHHFRLLSVAWIPFGGWLQSTVIDSLFVA